MVRITIKSKSDGTTEYKTEGFQGDSCFAFTKRLEELMAQDGVVVDDKKVQRTNDGPTGVVSGARENVGA